MKNPTMVYKFPGTMHIDRVTKDGFDYQVVSSDEVEAALDQGWHGTPAEAKAAELVAENAPPTRAEIEAKAAELGIQFDKKTKDETLLKKISEALDAGDFL